VEVGGITQDRKFSLEAVRCLGACGLAPVMVVGNDTYGMITPGKAIEIVSSYR
jgi:NADH:ubiquinone oxidoreductase subunit E